MSYASDRNQANIDRAQAEGARRNYRPQPSDRVQVRDKRDGELAFSDALVVKLDGRVTYVVDMLSGLHCGVPTVCVEPKEKPQ